MVLHDDMDEPNFILKSILNKTQRNKTKEIKHIYEKFPL